MIDLTNKNELIEYLRSHNLYTKHSLGQNFLVDREVLLKIVNAADLSAGDTVIEIGPGLGVMTRELAQKAGKLITVEIDQALAEILEKEVCGNLDNCMVINSDILKLNIPESVGGEPYKVVANIPYYITSKILQLFLTLPKKPISITLLVQKEVAERICAKPGDMSVLSISVQAYGNPKIVDIVPASAFFPAPEVDSAILHIEVESRGWKMEGASEKDFFRAVKSGFASRRKTLVNNLSSGYHLDKNAAEDIIRSIGLEPTVRAQELSILDWAKLASKLK